jgi:predicted nucleotide-binding protein
MIIEPKLKPLYANLKRLKIGKYLNTNDFNLFCLENNIDVLWKDCKKEFRSKQRVIMLGHHNTEDEEESFAYLLTLWFEQDNSSFGDLITTILINFAHWSSIKIDLSNAHHNLKDLDLSQKVLLSFAKEFRRIRDSKPEKLVENHIKTKKAKDVKLDNKKVFIVHGHDDKARLELSKIIKDDLGLEPIILQEEPNVSIETIIEKFERLAKDCSSAIILFTPDDNANGKLRARQNVILELGYFLGKFQNPEQRRIAIIKTGNIEIPSDISGVLYLEYIKSIKEIYYDLNKQFETWGIK